MVDRHPLPSYAVLTFAPSWGGALPPIPPGWYAAALVAPAALLATLFGLADVASPASPF